MLGINISSAGVLTIVTHVHQMKGYTKVVRNITALSNFIIMPVANG